MKFILGWASHLHEDEEIDINTMDELMELVEENSNGIIVDNFDGVKRITIYDDYME